MRGGRKNLGQLFQVEIDFKMRLVVSVLFTLLLIASAILVGAVTWSDNDVRLTTYVDFDGIPAIIETHNGTLWIFWTRKIIDSYNLFYVTSINEGARWSQETQLTINGTANSGVSACQASDGTIWVVWASDRTGNYEIFYKASPNFGASWSNDTQLTFYSGRDLKPAIHQMSDESIWIVWASDRSGGYDLYRKLSFNNGISWSDDIQLTTDSSLDKMPSLTETSDNTIWVVWASDRTGNYDLYYKTSSNFGASWSEDTQGTSGPMIDSNPHILQTIDEKIWIFFSQREPTDVATDDIYYMYSPDNGVTWPDIFQFTTDKYDDIWPSVVQTHLVKIWVVWTSDRADQPDWGNYDIYYKISLVGDVNGDGVVNVIDITLASIAFGSFEGESGYDPDCDINADGIVDMRDLSLVAMNLGAT